MVPGKNGPWKNGPRKNDPREKYLGTGYHLTHVKVNFSQGQFSRAYSAIPFERIFLFLSTDSTIHTTMLDAHPTILCYRVFGLLSSFGFS